MLVRCQFSRSVRRFILGLLSMLMAVSCLAGEAGPTSAWSRILAEFDGTGYPVWVNCDSPLLAAIEAVDIRTNIPSMISTSWRIRLTEWEHGVQRTDGHAMQLSVAGFNPFLSATWRGSNDRFLLTGAYDPSVPFNIRGHAFDLFRFVVDGGQPAWRKLQNGPMYQATATGEKHFDWRDVRLARFAEGFRGTNLLAVVGSTRENPIVCMDLSSDGGESWQGYRDLVRGVSPNLMIATNGVLTLFYLDTGAHGSTTKMSMKVEERNAVIEMPRPGRIMKVTSRDGDKWTSPIPANIQADAVSFSVFPGRDAKLWLVLAQPKDGIATTLQLCFSTDGGSKWSKLIPISSGEYADSVPSGCEWDEGVVVAYQRTTRNAAEIVKVSRMSPQVVVCLVPIERIMKLTDQQDDPGGRYDTIADRQEAVRAIGKLLTDADPDVRRASCDLLSKLSTWSYEVFPNLIERFADQDERVRVSAEKAILSAGVVASPYLEAELKRTNSQARSTSARLLRNMSSLPGGKRDLSWLLNDVSEAVREEAIASIGDVGDHSDLKTLDQAMNDGSVNVRVTAARSLGVMGKRNANVFGPLSRACKDHVIEVRRTAVEALTMFDGGGDEAVRALTLLLKDTDREVRKHAAAGLGVRRVASAVPNLVAALGDESEDVKLAAVAALDLIGADARAAVPALCRLARGGSAELRSATLGALADIKDPSAVPVALGSLKDTEERVRREAVSALGDIGFASPEVVKGLCSALRDKESSVRSEAVQALEELGGKAKTAVPDLIETMRTDKNLRYLARTAIEEIGDAQSVKMVRDALTNEKNEEVRTILAGLIKSLDDRSKED